MKTSDSKKTLCALRALLFKAKIHRDARCHAPQTAHRYATLCRSTPATNAASSASPCDLNRRLRPHIWCASSLDNLRATLFAMPPILPPAP